MRALILTALLLAGCAEGSFYQKNYETHGHCEVLCRHYSGIPTTMYPVRANSPQSCQCEAFPDKGEIKRNRYLPVSWTATITCAPDCKTVVRVWKLK